LSAIHLSQTPVVDGEKVSPSDPDISFENGVIKVMGYTAPFNGNPDLRVIRDHGSLEVFSGDGTISITMTTD
jgi:hypothetical protein